MQKIIFYSLAVFLLWLFPSQTSRASFIDRLTLGNATLSPSSPSSTPLPPPGTPGPQAPAILSPFPGQALQGNVPILARSNIPGFVSSTLSFSYTNNPTQTWFLIDQVNKPVMYEALAHWDTTTIADGEYNLQLLITLSDGRQQTITVSGVRVRNYTSIETDTPSPDALTETSISSQRSAETQSPVSMSISPTLTPFPSNPAEIDQHTVFDWILRGSLFTMGLFILGILYSSIRNFLRNRSNI
jgi:hypothetical protein